jgi:5-methylcytosine-specific restriction protein A
VLKRDGYQCRLRGPRCIGKATECDHIINVKSFTDPNQAEADTNCQAACRPCHQDKTAQEGVQARGAQRARLKLPTERHPGLR